MSASDRKLIYLLWTVIAVLVIGFIIGGLIVMKHMGDIEQTKINVGGDNASLKRQVQQLKAAASATPSGTPLATPEPTATPATSTPTPAKR
jgi:ABC-type Na+ efflux pump permease subunit